MRTELVFSVSSFTRSCEHGLCSHQNCEEGIIEKYHTYLGNDCHTPYVCEEITIVPSKKVCNKIVAPS